MNVRQKQAVTAVFWDIKKCPVPSGYDARQVGPCIKRCLENLGYSGPLTIFAVGVLTDVPVDVLRAVSSSGIPLRHVTFDRSFMSEVSRWFLKNPAPANIMVITDQKLEANFLSELQYELGYNIIQPFPYEAASGNAEDLLKCFLLAGEGADSGSLEFPVTGESAASWVCNVCMDKYTGGLAGQGFENFTKHLSSQEHQQQFLGWLPQKIRLLPVPNEEVGVETPFDGSPPWSYTPMMIEGRFPPVKLQYVGSQPYTGYNDAVEDEADAPLYSDPGTTMMGHRLMYPFGMNVGHPPMNDGHQQMWHSSFPFRMNVGHPPMNHGHQQMWHSSFPFRMNVHPPVNDSECWASTHGCNNK